MKAPDYRVVTIHGEGRTLFHIVDEGAPIDEQPAIVATFDRRAAADHHLRKLAGSNRALPREWYVRRYPRLIAHVICESLGYALPTVAAQIVKDAHNGQENWCEWIHACYGRKPEKAVRAAIQNRHRHKGYMAEIKQAQAIVQRAIDDGSEPMLASWF